MISNKVRGFGVASAKNDKIQVSEILGRKKQPTLFLTRAFSSLSFKPSNEKKIGSTYKTNRIMTIWKFAILRKNVMFL